MTELIAVDKVEPNPWNPNVMGSVEYDALKLQMQEHGVDSVDPVLVSPKAVFMGMGETTFDSYFVIVDGEHRWRIAKELSWPEVRCEVRDISEDDAKAICYRRNRQRGNIDPFKEAALFKSELERRRNQKDIAAKYGVDPSTVSHRLSLLKLTPEVLTVVQKVPRGILTPSHLEPLATLEPEDQKQLFQRIEQDLDPNSGPSVETISREAASLKREREQKRALAEALKTAKFPKCPLCKSPPGRITHQGLPWVDCSKHPWSSEHEWNLDTGKRRYEPVRRTESLDRAKRPEISRMIRCDYTVKQLIEAFFKAIHNTLPQFESAEKITVAGMIGKNQVRIDFDHNRAYRMGVHISCGGSSIGINAEEKKYRTGQKSKVDVSDWTPTKQDIERHLELIENAFKGVLLPIPEKKPKRVKGKIPPAEETADSEARAVPCDTCENDSEKGGDCHREHFHVDSTGSKLLVCEQKRPTQEQHTNGDEEPLEAANIATTDSPAESLGSEE